MLWGCYELLKKLDWVEKMPSRERGHCSLWVLFTAKAGDKTRSFRWCSTTLCQPIMCAGSLIRPWKARRC